MLVAKWLFEVGGGAKDARTSDNDGWTPMYFEYQESRFEVAEWLLEVGGAEDVRTLDANGVTPMIAACQ